MLVYIVLFCVSGGIAFVHSEKKSINQHIIIQNLTSDNDE